MNTIKEICPECAGLAKVLRTDPPPNPKGVRLRTCCCPNCEAIFEVGVSFMRWLKSPVKTQSQEALSRFHEG